MTGGPVGAGVLPVDKPSGPTSHDVVRKVRSTLNLRRVGHTGTLDPFASGLLLVCVGAATRLSEYLTSLDKVYRATFVLGTRTTTHDPEGEVVAVDRGWEGLDRTRIEAALAPLRGEILQRPPVFSAKKVAGEAAHRRARRGETVTLAPSRVRVFEMEIIEVELPAIRLEVRCSSGTYIRALARDLGEGLGVGAHVSELRRLAVGRFRVEGATPMHDLAEADLGPSWISPAEALAHLPRLELGPEDATRLSLGGGVPLTRSMTEGGPIAVVRGASLVAVAAVEGGVLRPRKVFK